MVFDFLRRDERRVAVGWLGRDFDCEGNDSDGRFGGETDRVREEVDEDLGEAR